MVISCVPHMPAPGHPWRHGGGGLVLCDGGPGSYFPTITVATPITVVRAPYWAPWRRGHSGQTGSVETGDWRLETGDWRLETGNWRLETGHRRLEAGDWRLETADWRLQTGDWRLETGNWRLEFGALSLKT